MTSIKSSDLTFSAERKKVSCTELKGFYVLCGPRSITFYLRYTGKKKDEHGDNKRPDLRLGQYDEKTFNLTHAVGAYYANMGKAKTGIDVAMLAKRQRGRTDGQQGTTFATLIQWYLEDCQKLVRKPDGIERPRKESWKNDRDYLGHDRSRMLRPFAVWGDMLANDITDDDVADLLEEITDESPVSANRCRSVLSTCFKYGMRPGRHRCMDHNPCATLAPRNPEIAKKRYLSPAEIRILWAGLDRPDFPYSRQMALAYKAILATMLRPGEVTTLERERAEGGVLIVPMHLAKARREDIWQPMSTLAREIINEAKRLTNGDLLFYGITNEQHLRRNSLAQALRGKQASKSGKARIGICEFLNMTPFTPHDLRRTGATLAGWAGVDDRKISRALDHSMTDVSSETAKYNQAVYIAERREVVDAIDMQLRRILAGEKPVQVHLDALLAA
jgi:integrase